MAGAELSTGTSTTVGLQATLQQVKNFLSPDSVTQPILRQIAWQQAAISGQTSATQHGLTMRLASRWWNDTLMAETSGIIVWPSGSGIWRTRLNFAIDDRWNLLAGTDLYFGPQRTFYGQLNKNRLLYLQIRYGL